MCGLYRNKSRFLVEASRRMVQQFNGRVPDNFVDLVSLPGVGRKTANVILYNAFGRPALAVDTHVYRVTGRIGIRPKALNVEKAHAYLEERIPEDAYFDLHLNLIHLGRQVCGARRRYCSRCPVEDLCEFDDKHYLTDQMAPSFTYSIC